MSNEKCDPRFKPIRVLQRLLGAGGPVVRLMKRLLGAARLLVALPLHRSLPALPLLEQESENEKEIVIENEIKNEIENEKEKEMREASEL